MNHSVLETAKEIRKNVLNNSLEKKQYEDFEKRFPKFYEMLLKQDMDEEMFNMLLKLLSKKSADDQNAASEFSQFGAEKYVYPQFGKPSTSDLQLAKSKIDKLS